MDIKLITDSACDLPLNYIKDNNIEFLSLGVNLNNEYILDDLGDTLKYDYFYKELRDGKTASTSQVNIYAFEEVFEKYVKEGKSIIYIGLSSGLSGTINSANIAKQNILEKYENADISIIDSISASLGEGALVYYACEMLKDGKDKYEVVNWIEENKGKILHAFTVDDLSHLKRGGRISSAAATVGSLLNIKPILTINNEGKVIQAGKIKGRKKAIKYLGAQVKEKAFDIENQVIFIAHADCEKEANELKEIVLKENNIKKVILNSMGAVIGAHGGPGTLAVIFIGESRNS
ncbi:DegV family protein [Clostridium senegalense]